MQIKADTVEKYMKAIPDDRREAVQKLLNVIHDNIPEGFIETIQYSMPCYVVPHERYPAGYHASPKDPLPFLSIASQKTMSPCIIWESMQMKNYCNGFGQNTRNTAQPSWIWERVASDSKIPITSPLS